MSRLSQKVKKYYFWIEEKTNKAKLEIFKFLRKSAESQGYIAFDKISRNRAFYGNSINIHLLGHLCDAEFISVDENSTKSSGFHENAKIIENH